MTNTLLSFTLSVSTLVATITSATVFAAKAIEKPGNYAPGSAMTQQPYLDRLPEDEIIYFVLPDRFENGDTSNDRGGISGGKLQHGFDPTSKAFYNGGDLKGVIQRLDYIAELGASAIWLAPLFKNKAVQGEGQFISAGYHGYWITDFTTIDPHFGTEQDFKTLVDEAHKRGIKVIMDIVTNHTADVIAYRECHDPKHKEKAAHGCPYRNKQSYPYTQIQGNPRKTINPGFVSDNAPHQTYDNFENLTQWNFAYTPYIPKNEQNIKVPQWLNDIRYYHNRGESSFKGESSLFGDFAGLDDVFTEHPRVVEGFIDIYKEWITKYKVDGFRADTVKHVNAEFWQQFVPAIKQHAKKLGINNFYMFAEVHDFEPALLARSTRLDGFPSVIDFANQKALRHFVSGTAGPSHYAQTLEEDILYPDGYLTANQLAVFAGNHDMGRIGHFLFKDIPNLTTEEAFKRSRLAHALILFGRGVPVIYYGDEQGFTGDGHDQDARESLFPSKVASYNDNTLIGYSDETKKMSTAENNFDKQHPLYKSIQNMAKVFHRETGLRRGRQKIVFANESPGVLAFTRQYQNTAFLVAMNSNKDSQKVNIPLTEHIGTRSIIGQCPSGQSTTDHTETTSNLHLTIPPLDFVICELR